MTVPHGVCVAFSAGPHVVDPTWTRLDTLAGCRVQSWSINRGRPTELEKTGAGTALVRIADRQGLFDPTNGSSPYFPNVLPDKQAAIAIQDPVLETWHTLFRGFVDDWSYTLDPTRQVMYLELELVDAFGFLADTELMPGLAGDVPPEGSEGNVVYGVPDDDGELVSSRMERILADANWPAGLSEIFSGNVRVTQQVMAPGTDALTALFDCADAEFPAVANLYVGAGDEAGMIVFHGRQARFRPDVAEYKIRRQECGDPSATSLDPTICPISELGFNLGKANLYNSVMVYPQHTEIVVDLATVITEEEIAGQVVEDTASITAHGKKSLSFTDLLTLQGIADGTTALEETMRMATYHRDNYQAPLPRVNRLVFKSRRPDDPLAGPLWKMICRADISDLITITSEHPGGGGFSAEDYYVEGLRYDARPGPPEYPIINLELDVSPRALFDVNPFDTDTDP